MAHIATLRKRAAALGYTIVKQVDGKASESMGSSLYTIGKTDHEHDNTEMLSLSGIEFELNRFEKWAKRDALESARADNHDVLDDLPASAIYWQNEARFYNTLKACPTERHVSQHGVIARYQEILADTADNARQCLFALVDANRPVIDCPFNSILAGDLERDLRARITMERDICFAIIRAALDAGYSITVYDGDCRTLSPSKSFVECARALFTTDENFIEFRNIAGRYVGSVTLIYGNDGFDVVSDYSAPNSQYEAMKEFMRPIANLADKLESELN